VTIDRTSRARRVRVAQILSGFALGDLPQPVYELSLAWHEAEDERDDFRAALLEIARCAESDWWPKSMDQRRRELLRVVGEAIFALPHEPGATYSALVEFGLRRAR
jgi:hypothetical protein